MASTAGLNDKDPQASTPIASTPASDTIYTIHVDIAALPPAEAAAPAPEPAEYVVVRAPPSRTIIPPPPRRLAQSTSVWKINFCSCLTTPAHCCSAFCFPCVSAGYAAHGIGRPGVIIGIVFFALYIGSVVFASRKSHTDDSWYGSNYGESDTGFSFTIWNTLSLACALAFITATAVLRGAVRSFDRIPGSTFGDVCASFWCSCCVLSQLSAHTERVKPLRRANAATLPAYHAL